LHEYLQVVISSEDSEKLKPHPDPLLEALKRVEAEAIHAVMVGDSHVDIQAGIAAGTKTIRCLYGVNQERLHDPEPDAFVGSISEVTPLVSKLF
jgi:phosphoglycolate phosphatase-like HAD superfamily hydrolase